MLMHDKWSDKPKEGKYLVDISSNYVKDPYFEVCYWLENPICYSNDRRSDARTGFYKEEDVILHKGDKGKILRIFVKRDFPVYYKRWISFEELGYEEYEGKIE